MFFYILMYVMLPFHEEISEFKSLQIVSPIVYWTAYYLFDVIVHTLYCGILYGVHVYADKNHIFGTTEYSEYTTIDLPVINGYRFCHNFYFFYFSFIHANLSVLWLGIHCIGIQFGARL